MGGWDDDESDPESESDEGESDASAEDLPPVRVSDALGVREVQAALGILRDSLGLAVDPPAEEVNPHSLFFTSSVGPSSSASSLVLPVDPLVSGMATSLGAGPSLFACPRTRGISLKEDTHASLLSGLPIPREAWERLEAFGKARPPSSAGGSCALSEPGVAARESDLVWFSSAASYGVELCTLSLYVTEWLHRAERALIPTPSPQASSFMLGLAAKLARASLGQHLRTLIKATRQRREQLIPLCSLPALAAQRFSTLPLTGPDLFAGRFQQTVSGEAERRKALRETTFSLEPLGTGTAPASFRGQLPAGGRSGKKSKRRTPASHPATQPPAGRPGSRVAFRCRCPACPRANLPLLGPQAWRKARLSGSQEGWEVLTRAPARSGGGSHSMCGRGRG